MYEWLLVLILHSKGNNATVSMERFGTQGGCEMVKNYVSTKADLDSAQCFKVLK